MPMTPNIIQTMKHTVKASVLAMSTLQALELLGAGAAARGTEGAAGGIVILSRTSPAIVRAACRRAHPPHGMRAGWQKNDGRALRPTT